MAIPRENGVNPTLVDTLKVAAAEALTKNRFVTEIGEIAGAGEAGIPIDLDYAIGDQVSVIRSGTAKVLSGAAVSIGDDVESDSTGRAITLDSGVKNGRAITAATTADQLIVISVP
jgi:hypothetical protein